MATLLKTLRGTAELDRLREAYSALATAYLAHRGQASAAASEVIPTTYAGIRRRVLAGEQAIPLASATAACDLITAAAERPVEVYNNLCHVEVLIAAIDIMRDLGLDPTSCAPTQQSQDDEVKVIADLSGSGWVLDAFGGHNCDSNKKLFEDLCTLNAWGQRGDVRLFLAFREEAWAAYRAAKLRVGAKMHVQGVTKKTRTDYGQKKVGIRAALTPRGCRDGVWVVEVSDLICEARKPRRAGGKRAARRLNKRYNKRHNN